MEHVICNTHLADTGDYTVFRVGDSIKVVEENDCFDCRGEIDDPPNCPANCSDLNLDPCPCECHAS